MNKFIEITEVPLLLFVLGQHAYLLGNTYISIFLLIVGIFRLTVNLITYKQS